MIHEEKKTAHLDAQLPESVLILLRRAADLQGRTLSEFVVCSAREAAEKAIAQHELLELSAVDQQNFAKALLEPPPVSDAMKAAAARHAEIVEPS